MSYFSSAWKAIAEDPFGEALSTRVYIRSQTGINYWSHLNDAGSINYNRFGFAIAGPTFNRLNKVTSSVEEDTTGNFVPLCSSAQTVENTYELWRSLESTENSGVTYYSPSFVRPPNSEGPPSQYYATADDWLRFTLFVYSAGSTFGASAADANTALTLSIKAADVFASTGGTSYVATFGRSVTDQTWSAETADASLNVIIEEPTDTGSTVRPSAGWTRISLELPLSANPIDYRYEFVISAMAASFYYSSPQIDFTDTSGSTPERYDKAIGLRYTRLPGELIVAGEDDTTLRISNIEFVRERDFGIFQGQRSQAVISNADLSLFNVDTTGSWCAVQVGFVDADIWDTAAQGQITDTEYSTDGTVVLQIDDLITDMVKSTLYRDMFIDEDPWIGQIKTITQNDSSTKVRNKFISTDIEQWESDATSATTVSGRVIDQRWTIEFSNSTEFRIKDEDGKWIHTGLTDSNGTGGTLSSAPETGHSFNITEDAFVAETNVDNALHMFTIKKEAWEVSSGGTPGTFNPGDTFQFSTSRERSQSERTPVGICKSLITNVAGYEVVDVYSEENYVLSPFYNETYWDEQITESQTESQYLKGFWKAGTSIAKMMQEAMMIIHGTMFSTPTGQLGLYVVSGAPSETNLITLNGNPNAGGGVNVLSAKRNDSVSSYANSLTLEFKDIDDGSDTDLTVTESSLEFAYKNKKVSTSWWISPAIANTFLNRAIIRFAQPLQTYDIKATLAAADHDLILPSVLVEPFLAEKGEKYGVYAKSIDAGAQIVDLKLFEDPLSQINVAIVDVTLVNDDDYLVW